MPTLLDERPEIIAKDAPEPKPAGLFRLVVTVKRGSASTLPAASTTYATIDEARAAAAATAREERVQRVMIVRDTAPDRAFVEWVER